MLWVADASVLHIMTIVSACPPCIRPGLFRDEARLGARPPAGPLWHFSPAFTQAQPHAACPAAGHCHGGLLGARPARAASREKRVGEARGEPPWLLPIDGLLGSCPAQPAVHVNTLSEVSHNVLGLAFWGSGLHDRSLCSR